MDKNRLQVAKEMGATYTVKVTTRDSRELARQIVDTLGCNPDRTMECSGAAPSIATAIYVSMMMASPVKRERQQLQLASYQLISVA